MNFVNSERSLELQARMNDFMADHVLPAEATYARERAEADDPHALPPVVETLKDIARDRGLWQG